MTAHPDANRLGAYLRARRGLVTPQQAGIPAGENRRVPGLRREEVAMLAGISADYYLRLERGRDTRPSPQVLDALARVLRLDDVERSYLHGLVEPGPRPRVRAAVVERVPARLHHLLATIGVPAFVEGRAFDVLASNDLAVALSPRLRPGENRLRSLLLDPEEQAFQKDWAASSAGFIAAFRESIGDDIADPRVIELVGELSLTSGRFRELWARHDVRAHRWHDDRRPSAARGAAPASREAPGRRRRARALLRGCRQCERREARPPGHPRHAVSVPPSGP